MSADTLTVVIEGVPVSEGRLMLQIMAGEQEFRGEAPAVAAINQRESHAFAPGAAGGR